MDQLKALEELGYSLPSPAYIFGVILFGAVGFAAYRHGKKRGLAARKWLGVVLMFYPYAIADTGLLYTVGAGLCCALYYWRR